MYSDTREKSERLVKKCPVSFWKHGMHDCKIKRQNCEIIRYT